MKIFLILSQLFLVLQFLSGQITPQQQSSIDSLKASISNAKHDSTIINSLNVWHSIVMNYDLDQSTRIVDSMMLLAQQNLSKSTSKKEKTFFKKAKGQAYFEYAYIDYFREDYPGSINNFKQSLEIMEELGDLSSMSKCINNIGSLLQVTGDHDESIKYLMKSIKIDERLGDTLSTASSYNNIGLTHHDLKNYDKAIKYIEQGLAISEKFQDSLMISRSLNNLGITYFGANDFEKAMDYFMRSLEIKEAIHVGKEIASSYLNVGNAFEKLGEQEKMFEYHQKALDIYEKNDIQDGIAKININWGVVNYENGNYLKAIKHGEKALEISKSLGNKSMIVEASASLYESYKKVGRFENSLEMYELYTRTKDSVESEANQREVINQEYKYAYDKQAAEDSIKTLATLREQDAKLAIEKSQKEAAESVSKRNEIIIYFVLAIVGVILFFVYMVVKSLRLVREQKEKVDIAYDELEEKNNEILDSINYAKRIQTAILPPQKVVKSYLPFSFVLYKPKDIVAGDFYWMEPVEDKVLFATCDCTGHGVPGAMVSVVCNNGLNRSVREYGLTDPGAILDKTREIVISEFEKSEEEVKDGMDVALCSLEGNTLKYAGANNPLWIIRKGSSKIEEIKADKQPIGKFDHPVPYSTHEIELNKGDTFYIFSDGYADQFGGEKGKKFKASNFKNLLLSIQNEDIAFQRDLIDKKFETWMGSLEQLDDVCVIGVRL